MLTLSLKSACAACTEEGLLQLTYEYLARFFAFLGRGRDGQIYLAPGEFFFAPDTHAEWQTANK